MERQFYMRPSGAGAWSRCHGYAALNAALGVQYIEEADNEVREDGIACHWLAAQLWEGALVEAGALAPNGREITEEMMSAVDDYHLMLRSWECAEIQVERLINVSRFFPGVSDGTPDAWALAPALDILHIGDLKFGYRPVEVWRNAQLIVYAWSLVCSLASLKIHPQQVTLWIHQPRLAHRDGTVRSWAVGIPELADLAAKLAAHAQACYAPAPDCTVNPGCGDCPGAYACRTLQAAAGHGMEVSYDATPFVLNEKQIGYELMQLMQASKHIEHRITGLSTQAESLIRGAKRIPGFEMGPTATRWRWREGTQELVRRMGALLGVDVMEPPKVKSVAKLRNAFPSLDIQGMYAEKPHGALKLRQSDPNEAIKRFSK